MSADKRTKKRPFPKDRPEISIIKSGLEPFTIDLRELSWWFIVPQIGDEVSWADYEPLEDGAQWRLTETRHMVARRKAIIHGRECVEIEIDEQWQPDRQGLLLHSYSPEESDRDTRVWGRLADGSVEWLAVERMSHDGTREIMTYLDDDWACDFEPSPRVIEDSGYLIEQGGSSFERSADAPQVFASGAFTVRIGEQEFECMRVFDIEMEVCESDVMVIAYINREGRTVLFRRYNGNRWGKRDEPPHAQGAKSTWESDLPQSDRLVIDGVTFVHYYDSLTDWGCGIQS